MGGTQRPSPPESRMPERNDASPSAPMAAPPGDPSQSDRLLGQRQAWVKRRDPGHADEDERQTQEAEDYDSLPDKRERAQAQNAKQDVQRYSEQENRASNPDVELAAVDAPQPGRVGRREQVAAH